MEPRKKVLSGTLSPTSVHPTEATSSRVGGLSKIPAGAVPTPRKSEWAIKLKTALPTVIGRASADLNASYKKSPLMRSNSGDKIEAGATAPASKAKR